MKIIKTTRIWLIPLLLAWIFDLLFWRHSPGISFPLFVVLCLASGLFLAYSEGQRPARASLFLLPLILIFAGMAAVRQEPLTTMVNFGFALAGLAILSMTLLGGQWLRYSSSDYVVKTFQLGIESLVNPIKYFFGKKEDPEASDQVPPAAPPSRRWIVPVLRGALLAFPVLALLAGLLASADPIFSKGLEDFLRIFQLENLGEYIYRGFYILILAFILMGVFLYSLTNSQKENLIGLEKPWLAPFLGSIESTMILGSVDLLFAAFVAIQLRYFFGGQANITVQGFTYADYARRGFSELVVVALVSLVLYLGLSSITRRQTTRQRNLFTGLGIVLVLLVLVILVSAFQRLLLYENAYGFSQVRTYTHIFILWLGLLLAATIFLEIIQQPRSFALMAVLASIGFGLTLNGLNVDSFIARENVKRALQGQEFDSAYLVSLSNDATPTLVELFTDTNLPQSLRNQLGAALACRVTIKQENSAAPQAWPSFHFSSYAAQQALSKVRDQLSAYPVTANEQDGYQVLVGTTKQPCRTAGGMD